MVPTVACRCATWASRATATRSRKRRWVRSLITLRNHVAGAEIPSPAAAASSSVRLLPRSPSESSFTHNASSASGKAASIASVNETDSRAGSAWYPRLSARHMEDNAGGNASGGDDAVFSGEDIQLHSFFARSEARCLQFEHGPVSSSCGHQLVMAAEFHDTSLFEHADAAGVPHGREAVR